MHGNHVSVPPMEPPADAPIYYCRNHIQSSGKCLTCIDVEHRFGPATPAKFYESMIINFKAHNELIVKLENLKDAQEYDKNNLTVKDLSPLDQAMTERFPRQEYNYRTETDQIKISVAFKWGLYICSAGSRIIHDPPETLAAGGPRSLNPVLRRKKVNKNIFEEGGRKKERIRQIWQGRPLANRVAR